MGMYRNGVLSDGTQACITARSEFFREWCESPIEFGFAMVFSDHERVQAFAPNDVPDDFHEKSVVFIPQLKVGRYRLDFAVLFKVEGRVQKWAVECDGREWHSSESQIDRDKKRDRFLMHGGWRVLRYAGHSIHYGAGGMADRVHMEIDAFRSGQDSASIEQYFDPDQFEEIGDTEAARWYRETKPRSYQAIIGEAA